MFPSLLLPFKYVESQVFDVNMNSYQIFWYREPEEFLSIFRDDEIIFDEVHSTTYRVFAK